ncbi:HAMP domain-containing sensor histidine kinase [Paenibacillus sp. FSL W8-0186]|uniref:Heme sensor protein HssS n=1 Tax=Paenibacillus woosongensis TaxID=307580 RepID=A0ABQ4MPP4_9BACL|nr:HAMP domain-containing sensor histidine kinase [Paenibacillus woosongensis]GIP57340.1 two-component sensor histidine kinase [Paenibacillus woosongensis]
MKSLYLRIVITTIFVMILSFLIAFIGSNLYYQHLLKPFNDQKITAMAKSISTFYEQNPELDPASYFSHVGELGYQMYLVQSQEHGSYFGDPFRETKLDDAVVQSVLRGEEYHGVSKFTTGPFVTGFFDNVLINTVGVPLHAGGEVYALFVRPNVGVLFGELRIFFAVLVVLSILLSILFVIVSTRYIVNPIVKLTEATKTLAQGKYNIQLEVKRRDEIGKLAGTFMQMAKSLEQLDQMRQEFVSNVSHEIQSPLASIQGFSHTLQSADLPEEQRRRYLAIIENESRRMSQLGKQLLMLASLDKEETILDKQMFDVSAQIRQVLFMLEWSWREKDLAVELDLPSAFIAGDDKLLHQVWINLITNSIKYTEPGGTIAIRLRQTEAECYVDIEDTGIGIAESDLPYVFNRFYRVDRARNRKEGSSGLGLAITQKIVELHQGRIVAASELGKGTTFHVTLPRY